MAGGDAGAHRRRALPIDWQDTVGVSDLPLLHRDPSDRLLVAQARRHDLVLATADRLVEQYDVPLPVVGGGRSPA